MLVLLEKPPPLFFELKLTYSYVIELADSESDLGFFSSCTSFGDNGISSNKSDMYFLIKRPFLHYISIKCIY